MAKWCTKNEPKKQGLYLVTVDWGYGRYVRQAQRIEHSKDNWFWKILPSDSSHGVIAWQKQPEPYEG